jgi:hypothetical protein
MEMANNLAAAAQGQKPSIKEQVEQKAGLMALQQAQMAQQQSAAAVPQPGGPVPEGTPEPEQQPQQEAGLDQLQSNIQMAGGGIIAFSGTKGSKVESEDDEDLPLWALLQRRAKRKAAAELEAERERNMAIARAEGQNLRPTMENDPRMLRAPAEESVSKMPTAAAPAAPKPPINDIAQLAAAQNKPRPQAPAAPAPAPAASAAPAAPAPESMEGMYRSSLANAPVARKVEDLIAEQKAMDKGLGLEDPAGKEKLERIAAIKDQYQATQRTPMQETIAMLARSGQYKGLSGLAPAYTSLAEEKRKSGLEMAEKINTLMGGVEDAQRAEKINTKTKVGTAREKDVGDVRTFDREKMQSLGTAATSEAQRKTQERGQDLTYRAAMAQVAATAARNNMELTANQRAMIADKALDNINATLKANMKLQMAVSKDPALMQQLLKAETDRLMGAAGGATMSAAPGAASPGGTTRMRFDAQGNQIK